MFINQGGKTDQLGHLKKLWLINHNVMTPYKEQK
jgi:hypothetical protein